MLKKLGILCVIAASSFGFTKGEAGIVTRSFTDTADIQNKDSINQAVISIKDPKDDFKDLFATTTLSNGVNIAQLNPLAISFVEDYIDSHSKMLDGLKDKARPYFD